MFRILCCFILILSCFAIIPPSQVLPCSASDYDEVFAPCQSGTRTVTLKVKHGVTCDAPKVPLQYETSCKCTLADYDANLPIATCNKLDVDGNAPEEGELIPFVRTNQHCTGGLAAVLPDTNTESVSVTCGCTDNDIEWTRSPCDPITNEQLVTFFYASTCKPGPGSPPLTPTMVTCDQSCPSGTYFGCDIGTEGANCGEPQCHDCRKGTYSWAGDVFDKWRYFPIGWSTGCDCKQAYSWAHKTSKCNCDDWALKHTHIVSGDALDDDTTSWVRFRDVVKNWKDAVLRFEYKVSSRIYKEGDRLLGDGLRLYINDEAAAFTPDGGFFAGGLMTNWVMSADIKLEPFRKPNNDVIKIEWAYEKDEINRDFADKALIKRIWIRGTQNFVPKCTACPAGTYNDATKGTTCLPCPVNTYSNLAGASQCKKCTEGQYTAPGLGGCVPMPVCTDKDYLPIGKCKNLEWKRVSQTCNPTEVQKTPQFYCGVPDKLSNCVSQTSKYYDLNSEECQTCEQGHFIRKDIKYGEFSPDDTLSNIMGDWTTYCNGMCNVDWSEDRADLQPYNGWGMYPRIDDDGRKIILNSGQDYGSTVESILNLTTTFTVKGTIKFTYAIFGSADEDRYAEDSSDESVFEESKAELFVNFKVFDEAGAQIAAQELSRYSLYPDWDLVTIHLPTTGRYSLIWSFVKNNIADPNLSIGLWDISIQGAEDGTPTDCTKCDQGYKCPAGSYAPIKCPPGQHSSVDYSSCEECDGDGEVGIGYDGEPQTCRSCGQNSQPLRTRNGCSSPCTFSAVGKDFRGGAVNFNITEFGPTTPLNVTADEYVYHISLCNTVQDDGGYPVTVLANTACLSPNDDDDDSSLNNVLVCQTKPSDPGFSKAVGRNRTTAYDAHSLGLFGFFFLNGDGRVVVDNHQWDIEINMGGLCHSTNTNRMARIKMICNTQVTDHRNLEFLGEEPHCVYNFRVVSPYACPMCTEDMYEEKFGECEEGIRRTWFEPKEWYGGRCFGGIPPKKGNTLRCGTCELEEQYPWCNGGTVEMVNVYQANASCWIAGNATEPTGKPCLLFDWDSFMDNSSGIAWYWWVAVVGGALLLLCALPVSVCLYCKLLSLRHKYKQINNDSKEPDDGHGDPSMLVDDRRREEIEVEMDSFEAELNQ